MVQRLGHFPSCGSMSTEMIAIFVVRMEGTFSDSVARGKGGEEIEEERWREGGSQRLNIQDLKCMHFSIKVT